MNADHLLIALAITVLALAAVIYLIIRFLRRGLSNKYQRPTKSAKEMTPWNALNAGEDPSL